MMAEEVMGFSSLKATDVLSSVLSNVYPTLLNS